MAAMAARQRQLLSAVLLCLGLLSCRVATAAEAVQKPEQVDVDAYALVQVPGCNVGKPNSLVLPPGVLNECEVIMPKVMPDDPQTFTFVIPKGAEMTAMFNLAVQGGTASMSVWLPGSSVESPPDMVQNELFSSPASSEGWISLNGQVLAKNPGQYILTVSSFSGTPTVVLKVWTPPAVLQLAQPERSALKEMAQSCCGGVFNNTNSPFCGVMTVYLYCFFNNSPRLPLVTVPVGSDTKANTISTGVAASIVLLRMLPVAIARYVCIVKDY